MKVVIGSDHGGYKMKEYVKALIADMGHEVEDVGTFSEESVDYPEYAFKVAKAVVDGRADRGVLLCGTGIGMSIVANRFPGIRAALCHDVYTAKMSRRHNDANVLVLGGRVLSEDVAKDIVAVWFVEEFEGGRHERRLNKIKEIESFILERRDP
ncbi:MAG: ribose 5-phosphate isomerase B [Deferribacteres bacterium]|nr:ribose 5-phosphate isomerase B [Deferribacteres bacterium]